MLSKEGVTQGDPLGMMFYGVGLLPLARKLRSDSNYVLKLKEDSTLTPVIKTQSGLRTGTQMILPVWLSSNQFLSG